MLSELKVSNFAIIENIHIHFEDGLNILSGETGAGKSVLLKSLSLLIGEKASVEIIKSGCNQAVIEGRFELSTRPDIRQNLEDMGIDVDDEHLVVRRTINTKGKSKVYLNGSMSTLNSLKDLISPMITVTGQAAPLIEMTGQHDNRHLQSKSYHLDTLDRFAGLWKDRAHFSSRFHDYLQVKQQIENLKLDALSREQRLDFLRFQKEELEALNIQTGEDEQMIQQMKRLKNIKKIKNFFEEAEFQLSESENSIVDQLRTLSTRAEEIMTFDDSLKTKLLGLKQAEALLEDVAFELHAGKKDLNEDSDDVESLEERFSQFRKLQKKYGESAEQFIAALEAIKLEIESLSNSDSRLEELQKSEAAILLELKSLAQKLHKTRLSAAKEFQNLINEELRELNMKGVGLEVVINQKPDYSPTGISEVEFMIRASKKEEPRSLARFASGGELSRILLSIKQVGGDHDVPRTYLFDEVDAGVSGVTAEKVGKKLRSIASGQQVICVTHLAQVAAFADVHYLIEKTNSTKGVEMSVRPLSKKDRVDEIARLISGENITKSSITHAKQLLKHQSA